MLFTETMLTDMEQMPSVKLGDYTLQFELGTPSPEILKVAKDELRETPEIQRKAIDELRELLSSK